jgi:3D (Asp-Asp-Asp) domain-containing protein
MSNLWSGAHTRKTLPKFKTLVVLGLSVFGFVGGYPLIQTATGKTKLVTLSPHFYSQFANPGSDSHVPSSRTCLKATNYFLPSNENYSCTNNEKIKVNISATETVKICPAAKAAAELQGSLQLMHKGSNYIYRYTGQTEKIKTTCTSTTGAAGVCLMAYLHVAADPKFHAMGDIIRIPQIRGTLIPRPDGKGLMAHPGYVIVADTGGAIKGPNRFDFFIGKMAWDSPTNPFGPAGHRMTDERNCMMSFQKIAAGSTMAAMVKTGIEKMLTMPAEINLAKAEGIAQ